MGEPVPGDIADPIRLSTTNIKIAAGLTGNKGDYLVKDGGNDWFTLVSTTSVGEIANSITDLGVVQAQEDFNSVGAANGEITVAGFDFQSRIYAFVATGINPSAKVTLQVLVDDTPGPAVVGFGLPTATDPIARFVKQSGDNPAQASEALAVGIIDLGAAN